MAKPLMILPRYEWRAAYPDPSLADLLERYVLVNKAIVWMRANKLTPPREWIAEVLGG